jgi:hypothetical protein
MTGDTKERSGFAEETFEEPGGMSPATVLFGLVLLILGSLWLLDVSNVVNVTWTLVGSAILILIGVLLIAVARHGSHGGMIFVGIVLSVIVLLGSMASWPSFEGGVGDRAITPETLTELEAEYTWGAGSQEIDLRQVDFPDGATDIRIQMGMGDLNVRVPDDMAYRIDWSVGVGDVQVFERSQSGVGLNGTYEDEDYDSAERQLEIEIQLGMGAVEVRR